MPCLNHYNLLAIALRPVKSMFLIMCEYKCEEIQVGMPAFQGKVEIHQLPETIQLFHSLYIYILH